MTRPGWTPLEERFWKYVVKTETCWLWTGAKLNFGYGGICSGADRRMLRAHRVSWEIHVGPIPEGMVINHLCRVTACVNPDHLEVTTTRGNLRYTDRALKIRSGATHCPQGHVYDEANTALTPEGYRRCKNCARTRAREQYRASHVIV